MLIVNLQNNGRQSSPYSRVEANVVYPLFNSGTFQNFSTEEHDCSCGNSPGQEPGHDPDNKTSSTTLALGQTLQGTGFRMLRPREVAASPLLLGGLWTHGHWLQSLDDCSELNPPLPSINLTIRDVTRWKMAWRALQVYKHKLDQSCWYGECGELLVRRCKDWPGLKSMLELPISLGCSATALIYGGLHALAWLAHFDSFTERLFWRISVCVVMGGLPCILGTTAYGVHILDKTGSAPMEKAIGLLALILAVLVLLAYVFARAYLVVECFINLSHLPAEVYDVPNWPAYFPHIS